MGRVFAQVRASWLEAFSYRLRMTFSIMTLPLAVVPLYFIAGALQPLMAESIKNEGQQYFGFVVVGVITVWFLSTSVGALPGALGSGVATGTLEALLSTPSRLPVLFAGMIGYGFNWIGIRTVIFLTAAWFLGAPVVWSRGWLALGILFLIVLAYLPFGVLAASLVLAFRTDGRLPQLVGSLSVFLGGVYFPTHVIPSWIEKVSIALPLTYGLRALRRTLLEGASFATVAQDLAILSAFIVVLFGVSTLAFSQSLRYAKRAGTLTQY